MKITSFITLLGLVAPCCFTGRVEAQSATADCYDRAAARSEAIPFFGPLFRGEFVIANRFDHDRPFEFLDGNRVLVDSCGRSSSSELDGHAGYDFLMPEGTPVLAPAAGVVVFAGVEAAFYCPYLGYEVRDQVSVALRHELPDGRRIGTIFKHLSDLLVGPGDEVHEGQEVGLSGNTGCSTTPHLHFETLLVDTDRSGKPTVIDPFGWAASYPDPWAENEGGAASIWLWKDVVYRGGVR